MAGRLKNHGVELHGNSYRYRMRVTNKQEGGTRVARYKRYPFVVGPEAKKLPPDHPLRKENAYAQALAYALKDRQDRKTPKREGGKKDPRGTLLEWLVRYQVEALEQRRYRAKNLDLHLAQIDAHIDRKGREPLPADPVVSETLPFQIVPRSKSGVEHDKSQIRSLVRLGRHDKDVNDMLHTEVEALGVEQFHQLLALWAGGAAKPKTKRRLICTLSAAWNHHDEFHNMELAKPWLKIKIPGDGSKPKARAIPKAELAKIEAELVRLHPHVRGAIEFLRWTGARRSEAAKLRWEQFMWPEAGAPSAHFERTKAARGVYKARFVYLEDGCIAALARMLKPVDKKGEPIVYGAGFDWRKFDWPKSGWVFPAPMNPKEQIHGQTIYQAFVRSVKHAGVPHASPHMLRHTKATVLTATVPQAMAQEMLGHDDAASFAIYRHLAEEAGYMVRDKQGQLVSAEELRSKDDIAKALKKLPKKERAALFAELLAD